MEPLAPGPKHPAEPHHPERTALTRDVGSAHAMWQLRAMQRYLRLCPLLLLAACGGGEATPAKKTEAAAPARSSGPELVDHSQAPLVATRETIDGVSFSIELPAGLKREEKPAEKWINWTFTAGNPFMEPSITVKLGDPVMSAKDLATMVRRATGMSQDKPPLVVAKQEELPGGGFLVLAERSDGQYFKLEAQHRSGDKIVSCSVGQRTGTGRPDDLPVPSFAATKAWAEKLCLSLKIE